jgi:cell division protein FtsQ
MRRLIPTFGPQRAAPDQGIARKSLVSRLKVMVGAILGLTSIAAAGYATVERDQLGTELITFSGELGLNLQYIQVRGRSHTPTEMLVAATDLKLGQPMLGIAIDEVHRNLSQIGWVEAAVVERLMPSTIKVTIKERIPIALLQTANGHELIDRTGIIIDGADPTEFSHLTVVAGTDAATNAGLILEVLRTEPELFSHVWAITFQSGRRWDVHLRNGIDIRLPESDPRTAWSRLAVVDHSKNIIGRDLAVIDLRVPEQLIVEPNIPVRGRGRNT